MINALAVGWLAFEAVNISWPRSVLAPGAPWYQIWAAPLALSAIAVVGLAYMLVAHPQRHVAAADGRTPRLSLTGGPGPGRPLRRPGGIPGQSWRRGNRIQNEEESSDRVCSQRAPCRNGAAASPPQATAAPAHRHERVRAAAPAGDRRSTSGSKKVEQRRHSASVDHDPRQRHPRKSSITRLRRLRALYASAKNPCYRSDGSTVERE